MKRYFKATLVLAAMAVALTLTIYRSGPPGLAGLEVAANRMSRAASVSDSGKPYDLASLRVLNMTLQRIRDNYVDPNRIQPKQMLLSALDYVQRNVAEVLVEPSADKNQVSVRVDTAQKSFDISGVDSPWALSSKLREIFKFVQSNLPKNSDARDIEYQAINGMLSTLDPHSQLLDPDMYRQMKIDTRGKFGGLGIGIGIRNDLLTVLEILGPQTPAAKSGLKPGDHIVRINDEATVNMLLNEAVSRLRGDPGTKVTVYVERKGAQQRKVVLERAIIDVPNVIGPTPGSRPKILKSGVGYVHIKQFTGTTSDDLRREIGDMQKQGLRGLILDLRGNPGGLLDQAIKVSDLFVEGGTLVTTVGYAGKQRDEKRAQADGYEPRIPLVVLVSGSSASASEIVAGALKNLDRALIVGQTTFGKGSVQVLYDNPDDESALKLTIAQYLTPGDVSIQSVGITPDVETIPVFVEKDFVSFMPRTHIVESELEQHLDSHNVRKGEKPQEVVRFLAPQAKKPAVVKKDEDDDETGDDEEDEPPIVDDAKNIPDFEVDFARDLLASVPQSAWRRRDLLAAAKGFFEKSRAAEQQKIAGALAKMNINWSDGPVQGAPRLTAQVTTDKPGNRISAGGSIKLRASVRNDGNGTAYQVLGRIKGANFMFDEKELILGKIAPGETKSYDLTVKIPKEALTQVDTMKLEFSDLGHTKIDPADLEVHIDGLARPSFAYSYQLIDDIKGNSDGRVQRGERARLLVTIKNLGPGRSFRTQATLKNNSGPGVFIHKGRFRVDNILPGQTRSVAFDVEAMPELQDDVQIELAVGDQTLREFVDEKLKFPLAKESSNVEAASGSVTTTGDRVALYSTPSDQGLIVGYAQKNGTYKVTGKVGNWDRVEIEPGRPAFVIAAQTKAAAGAAPAAQSAFDARWMVSPPLLSVSSPKLETQENKVHLKGSAKDDRKVSDLFVVVANRTAKVELKKVYYKSNRNGQNQNQLDFETEIPLWPGENYVQIVARENTQVQSRQTLVVLRKQSPTAVATPLPKK